MFGFRRESDDEWIRRHYEPVFRFLVGVSGSESDAYDLSQETFLKALRKRAMLRDHDASLRWLIRVAWREFLQLRRKRATDSIPDGFEQPEQAGLNGQWIRHALASLSDDHRAAIVLVDVVGLSIEEAARALEIPEGTLKSRRSHARGRLAEWLDPQENDHEREHEQPNRWRARAGGREP